MYTLDIPTNALGVQTCPLPTKGHYFYRRKKNFDITEMTSDRCYDIASVSASGGMSRPSLTFQRSSREAHPSLVVRVPGQRCPI